jgi:DNA polymerase II small subunit
MEELKKIFEKKNIEVFGELHCNEKEKLQLLTIFDILEEHNITIPLINEDLLHIFLTIDYTKKENIDILSKINWDDFFSIIKDQSSKRKEKIYRNFLIFLKSELNILTKEEELTIEKSLLEDHKQSTIRHTISKKIFEKQEDFDITTITKERAQKYGIEILFDYNETPQKISVNDFTLYFNRRLQYFTSLLSSRVSSENVVRISQLKDLYETNTPVTIIGLISDITETKNGHIMITLEDKSGQIKCFINKDKTELMNIVQDLCLDEGIGINGKVGKEIIWTDEIIIPSPPNTAEIKKTKEEHNIVFLSDIHFGAKVFQDEAFQKFLDWINGETQSEQLNEMAKKVTHVVIAGDLIEGIGIYPGQGKDARILSAEGQYHECARWLSQIPKHIGIIIIPGNHDTNRLSEPQPKLPYDKAYALYHLENVIITSNPSSVRLFSDDESGGLDIYMYHGGSYFYYGDKIQHLREKGGMKAPEEIVKFLLEKRHLAPSHGATLYIPDSQSDPLVIRKMPDIFVTGHTHKMGLANYKGCTIVSCSCWVEMSDYQEKMGMYPDIGKVIVINTKTRKPHILNFYTEQHKRKEKQEL